MKVVSFVILLVFLALVLGCSSLERGVYFSLVDNGSFVIVDRPDWVMETQESFIGEWRPPMNKHVFSNGTEMVIYPVILEQRYFEGPAFLPFISFPESWNRDEYWHVLRYTYPSGSCHVSIESINDIPVKNRLISRRTLDEEIGVFFKLNDEFCMEDELRVGVVCGNEKLNLFFERKLFKNFIPLGVPLF